MRLDYSQVVRGIRIIVYVSCFTLLVSKLYSAAIICLPLSQILLQNLIKIFKSSHSELSVQNFININQNLKVKEEKVW